MKVVINVCFGGFSLSPKAELWLWKRGVKEIGTPVKEYYGGDGKFAELHPEHASQWQEEYQEDLKEWRSDKRNRLFSHVFSPDEKFALNGREIDRQNPLLIECIEKLGKGAYGSCAELKIVEIPDGIDYEISEYDGLEHIAEKHKTWR